MITNKNYWLAGFFDGEGSASFSQMSPSLNIVNSDPKTTAFCLQVFKENGIEAKLGERSFPSKTKKESRKRWDLFINQTEEANKASIFLKQYIQGKEEQMILIQKYMKKKKNNKRFHILMKFLNQTNNIVIYDADLLTSKMELKINKNKLLLAENKDNLLIKTNSFNQIDYLAGIFDAEGNIGINKRKNKHRDTDRYTPICSIVNTNKKIVTAICSTLKNNNIGFHIQQRQGRNRSRWDVSISGVKRNLAFLNLIENKLISKRQQAELLHNYVLERIKDPYCINDIGHSYKEAIESLR
ncbi:MAG: hypothetical protein ACOCUR_02625 [Nanoarchaeota archaeon]